MKAQITVQLPSGRELAAGVITEVANGLRRTTEFRYENTYLADPEAYALSPDLPLSGGSFTPIGQRAMFGGIADAQPDDWGRRIIDAERRRDARTTGNRATAASELEVLLDVRDETRHGAIRARVNGVYVAEPAGPIPAITDLNNLTAAAKAFESGEEVPEQLRSLVAAGTSAGGARPKAIVVNSSGRLAIAKLPREDDFGDAMAWEATALELARRAGATVPPFKLHRNGYSSVLVVERFDRAGPRRVGYLSADSLLRKQPGEVFAYTDLAAAIAPDSASPRADTEELFLRVAITLMVNNIDDHMKNHGLLREDKGWRMSPLFDVNPHYRHSTADATPVTPDDDPRDRDIRNLLEASDSFGVTGVRAAELVRAAEAASSDWFDVALGFGISPEGARAMAAAFENPNRETARSLIVPSNQSGPIPSVGRQSRTPVGRFDVKDRSGPEAPVS